MMTNTISANVSNNFQNRTQNALRAPDARLETAAAKTGALVEQKDWSGTGTNTFVDSFEPEAKNDAQVGASTASSDAVVSNMWTRLEQEKSERANDNPVDANLDAWTGTAKDETTSEIGTAPELATDPQGNSVASGFGGWVSDVLDRLRRAADGTAEPQMGNRHGRNIDRQSQEPQNNKAGSRTIGGTTLDPNPLPIGEDDKPEGAQKFTDELFYRGRAFNPNKQPGTPSDETVSNPNPFEEQAPTTATGQNDKAKSLTKPEGLASSARDLRGATLLSKSETVKRQVAINPMNAGAFALMAGPVRV